MPYLGKSPQHGNYSKLDDFSGDFDGSDATHAVASNGVAITPVRPEALIISINGVIQEPTTDYTVSGTNITFTTAPTAGDNFFGVAMGEQLQIGTPSDATITAAKLDTAILTGHTDIGAGIADADLFLVDDGAGGTLRKTAASRIKTYVEASAMAVTGNVTATGTVEPAGDTSAGDNAAIGYTASEGLILTGQGSTSDITIKNDADGDVLTVATGTTTAAFLGDVTLPLGGEAFIGDTVNSKVTTGLTLNMGAADDEIFALKSSDVAHSLTSTSETDTYFSIQKWGSNGGGAYIHALAENGEANGLVFNVVSGDPAATANTTNLGSVGFYIGVSEDSPGTLEDFASNALLFSLKKRNASGTTSVFHVDEDGDIFYDGSASAFDNEDDALLARAFELERAENASPSRKGSEPAKIIKSEFDKFVGNAKEKLTNAGIISRCDPNDPSSYDEDGNLGRPMVNLTQLQRLHNGAIWQQRVMFETLKEVAEEMLPGFADKLNERLESRNLPALPV